MGNYEGLNDKVRIVALVPDSKEELKANINTRLNSMINEGMLEEVIKLKNDAGLTKLVHVDDSLVSAGYGLYRGQDYISRIRH